MLRASRDELHNEIHYFHDPGGNVAVTQVNHQRLVLPGPVERLAVVLIDLFENRTVDHQLAQAGKDLQRAGEHVRTLTAPAYENLP